MKKRMLMALQVCLAAVLGTGWTGKSHAAQMPNRITVTLRGANGAAMQALVLRISAPNGGLAPQTKIELRRVDDTYYLDKIWLAGQNTGYQVLSGAPRE